MKRDFEIVFDPDTGVVRLKGWFDAARCERAQEVLEQVKSSAVVDFEALEFISSGGLGALFGTQKRLMDAGEGLKLINLNAHIREVFVLAGFDTLFEMDEPREGLRTDKDP